MDIEQRMAYHMQEYGLTREQFLKADALMSGPIRDWPEGLRAIVDEAGARFGHSGDVFWECIVAFVKGQTLDEYLHAPDATDDAAADPGAR